MNWGGLPNLVAGTFLICAFVSIARGSRTPVSGLWLTGWLMILIHSASRIFTDAPGIWGKLDFILLSSSLTWAGVMFMYASIPYREDRSSRWMLVSLSAANSLYIIALTFAPAGHWTLKLAAVRAGHQSAVRHAGIDSQSQSPAPLDSRRSLHIALHLPFNLPEPARKWSRTGLECGDVHRLSGLLHLYLPCLSPIHIRGIRHHRRILQLGIDLRREAGDVRIHASYADRERGMESSKICGGLGHDASAAGRTD